MLPAIAVLAASLPLALLPMAKAAATTVFSTDFESGLPAEFTAPGSQIQGVQGWAGLGPDEYQFSGNFLRYTQTTLSDTKLSLHGLPPHDHLDLRFLLAVIDSWDGTELLQVWVDGELRFSHWFQIAIGDTSSYISAPGALLSSGSNLGFSNGTWYQRDRAYNMAVEPAFVAIPHTADSVSVVWRISAVSGPAAAQWQGGADESWAIERVEVEVSSQVVGVEPSHGAPALSLDGPRPNPASGGRLAVSFALPLGDFASLELFDLAGRRLLTREVGSLGSGRHAVDLGASGQCPPPGVYFLRLTQGEHTAVRRAVVID
jgi:hypothetical protein